MSRWSIVVSGGVTAADAVRDRLGVTPENVTVDPSDRIHADVETAESALKKWARAKRPPALVSYTPTPKDPTMTKRKSLTEPAVQGSSIANTGTVWVDGISYPIS